MARRKRTQKWITLAQQNMATVHALSAFTSYEKYRLVVRALNPQSARKMGVNDSRGRYRG